MPKVVGFCGISNSGKTTLIEKVTKALIDKHKILCIKHDPKNKATFDTQGKDSARFFALGADVFPVEHNHVLGVVAEDAGGLILFQHNGGSVHVDFQGVLLRDVQRAAQFNREHNAAEFVHFAYNTGRFQIDHPFLLT